jgi:hypothetical protein
MAATVVLPKELMERTLASTGSVGEACRVLGISYEKWRWWAKVNNIACGRGRKDTMLHGTAREKHLLKVYMIVESILGMPGIWDFESILIAIEDLFSDEADLITTKDVSAVLDEMELTWHGTHDWRDDHDELFNSQHKQIMHR